jgi:hypothetical protein
MTITVTAKYSSTDAVHNTLEHLVDIGLSRETIYASDQEQLVKVIVPDDIMPEVSEVIDRHRPLQVTTVPPYTRTH